MAIVLLDLARHRFLDPVDFVYNSVSVFFHETQSKLKFFVNDPQKQEPFCLQALKRDIVLNWLVVEGLVLKLNASRRVLGC